jgi:acetoin utilization protein AcuB
MLVQDIMTPSPITIDPAEKVSKALLLMYDHEIRRLPVIEKGRLVGIVSDRDIKQTMGPPSNLKGPLDDAEANLPVAAIMTRNPISIGPDDPVKVAIERILEGRISGLPVVNHEMQLVGIVSEIDIMEYCLDLIDRFQNS